MSLRGLVVFAVKRIVVNVDFQTAASDSAIPPPESAASSRKGLIAPLTSSAIAWRSNCITRLSNSQAPRRRQVLKGLEVSIAWLDQQNSE